jgi:hypothetical protein
VGIWEGFWPDWSVKKQRSSRPRIMLSPALASCYRLPPSHHAIRSRTRTREPCMPPGVGMRACQDRGGTPHHASMHAQSRACMRNSRPRDSSDQCPPSQQATRSRQQVSVSPESVAALFRSLTPFSSVALSAGTHVRSQQFLAAWGKRGARMGCAFHQTCPRVNLVGACSLFYKKGRAWWKA